MGGRKDAGRELGDEGADGRMGMRMMAHGDLTVKWAMVDVYGNRKEEQWQSGSGRIER